MALPVRIRILTLLLVTFPATAHAGWFSWLWGRTQTPPVVVSNATAVPAFDIYGLSVAVISLAILARGRFR